MRNDIQLQEHNQRLGFSVAVSLTDILALETLAKEALAESQLGLNQKGELICAPE